MAKLSDYNLQAGDWVYFSSHPELPAVCVRQHIRGWELAFITKPAMFGGSQFDGFTPAYPDWEINAAYRPTYKIIDMTKTFDFCADAQMRLKPIHPRQQPEVDLAKENLDKAQKAELRAIEAERELARMKQVQLSTCIERQEWKDRAQQAATERDNLKSELSRTRAIFSQKFGNIEAAMSRLRGVLEND